MTPLPADQAEDNSTPPENVVLLFDWDDTLLCTTAVVGGSPTKLSKFHAVAVAARAVLEAAQALGDTRIVTNSVASWLERSTMKYLPSLEPAIKKTQTMSARACYEEQWPGQPLQWKKEAFKAALEGKLSTCQGNVCVVALGDSEIDIEAARQTVASLGDRLLLKTVKFKELPTPDELVNQLQQTRVLLAELVASPGPSDVTLDASITPFLPAECQMVSKRINCPPWARRVSQRTLSLFRRSS